MSDEIVILTADEAIAMLPDGGTVHTFRQPAPGMLVGTDWDRDEVIAHIGFHGAELSGPTATGMGHGLVIRDLVGVLFVETKMVQP